MLAWYHHHALPVTPINPRTPNIPIARTPASYQAVTSPSQLPSPSTTSLSVVTPPPVTLALLREAKAAGVPAVWLQPGTFDDEGLRFARDAFEAGVGGEGGMGGEGWCVLVDGEEGLRAAGREWGGEGAAKI